MYDLNFSVDVLYTRAKLSHQAPSLPRQWFTLLRTTEWDICCMTDDLVYVHINANTYMNTHAQLFISMHARMIIHKHDPQLHTPTFRDTHSFHSHALELWKQIIDGTVTGLKSNPASMKSSKSTSYWKNEQMARVKTLPEATGGQHSRIHSYRLWMRVILIFIKDH